MIVNSVMRFWESPMVLIYPKIVGITYLKRLFDFIAGLRSHKSAAEVTFVMPLVWRFQKGLSCRVKYALFGLEVPQISYRGQHCIVLGVGFSKRYIM